MSKIGKKPIQIPENVNVEIKGQSVKVSGPKGELNRNVLPVISVKKEEQELVLKPITEDKTSNAFLGVRKGINTKYDYRSF